VVIATIEDWAAAPARSIHGTRETCRDALHPVRERLLALRFDDEVGVVALERVVRDAEGAALARLGEGAAELADDRDGAEGRHVRSHA
jgi:hypothetical protein